MEFCSALRGLHSPPKTKLPDTRFRDSSDKATKHVNISAEAGGLQSPSSRQPSILQLWTVSVTIGRCCRVGAGKGGRGSRFPQKIPPNALILETCCQTASCARVPPPQPPPGHETPSTRPNTPFRSKNHHCFSHQSVTKLGWRLVWFLAHNKGGLVVSPTAAKLNAFLAAVTETHY